MDNIGLDVEEYYACEIDDDAILVSMVNHEDSVQHLGDVRSLTCEKVRLLSITKLASVIISYGKIMVKMISYLLPLSVCS